MRLREMAARLEALELEVERLRADVRAAKAAATRATRAAKAAVEPAAVECDGQTKIE